MKIYTKTGDTGETGLFGGPRVAKDDPRIEAYGAVDELNSAVGIARAEELPPEIDSLLARIQNELFNLGAELATPNPAAHALAVLGAAQIEALEQAIDRHEASLPLLREFILPGGSRGAAALHLARTICRRAERRLVAFARGSAEPISPNLVVYLNRLGDLLFVLTRAANAAAGVADVPWRKRS
ncbi:MAG TPA: cob(I)yrinic acid a,c-diamide adenosyltransferase [Pirellulales bacterium]|jgi:cob(I)alamin adenosyltransferase|nr:cob(I)yrinic acid a,c-diamide adenosyltransferase [Pirellulales bacterium]